MGKRFGISFVIGVLAIALIGAPAAAKRAKPTPGSAVIEESFDAPSEWVIVDQDKSGAVAQDSEVVVEVREGGFGHRVFGPPDVELPAAYAVEVDARNDAGDADTAEWGVLCRATLNQDYLFSISTDGFFLISRSDGDGVERLTPKKDKAAQRRANKAIKRSPGATNRIRGECLAEGRFRLFVNGKFITEAVDPEPLTGGDLFGFAAYTTELGDGPLVVGFDNAALIDLT